MHEAYRKNREEGMKEEKSEAGWNDYNNRFIRTYSSILGEKFHGPILDVGAGTDEFSKACRSKGMEAEGIDVDRCNFEHDPLPYADASQQVVTLNAVIEHIRNPEILMKEIVRVLKPGGVVIMRTPNFQKDWKGFYNDPTHVKPYTPTGLSTVMKMYGLKVIFCEPGLICKSKLYWKMPAFIKWHLASWIPGGSKSIMAMGEKPIS